MDVFQRLGAKKIDAVEVDGETVHIRELTAGQSMLISKRQGDTLDYLAVALCTKEGEPIFVDTKEGRQHARKILEEISMHTMTVLMKAFNKLNGFDEGEEKNSETTSPADSSSDSQ